MMGELDVIAELRHFIQVLANQPCVVEAIAGMGEDVHAVCHTWGALKEGMLNVGKNVCGEEAFQTYNENDVVIPKSPMEKYIMTLMVQAMASEVVDPPKSEPADIIDFRTKKKI